MFRPLGVNAASKKASYNFNRVVYSQLPFTRVEFLSNFSKIDIFLKLVCSLGSIQTQGLLFAISQVHSPFALETAVLGLPGSLGLAIDWPTAGSHIGME